MRVIERLRLARLPLLALAFAACAPSRPPFTQPASAAAPLAPHEAALVFLWPSTSCDPPRYFTLATADGRFLGTISRGSRLSVSVPAGASTVIAWNDVVEATSGARSKETVPVLHADLQEGRTYYVRMLFGEWDEYGPPERALRAGAVMVNGNRYSARACVKVPESTTSAMVVVSPTSERWKELPEWMAKLEATVPDRESGQAWLDANRAVLESHLAVAQERFAALRPKARKLATIEPYDGAPP